MFTNFNIRYIFVILTVLCAIFVLCLLSFAGNEPHKKIFVLKYEATTIFENITEEFDNENEDFQDFPLKDYPNFPGNFYVQNAKTPKSLNETCGLFPTLDKILFNNLYWQSLMTENGEYQLLGAYWDARAKNKNSPTVRILAMITPLEISEDLYCQFWFKNKVVLSSEIYKYFLWYEEWGGNKPGNYKPYLISCKLPKTYMNKPPIAVSLVKKQCDQATNILKVHHKMPENKQNFAVCVKGLDFHDDVSIKLIEWIELLRILGAEKIFFYELHIHDEIKKIFNYYEDKNVVQLTPVTLPGYYPNEPYLQHLFLSKYLQKKRLYELISYNDCFLQHMYEYKYIVLLDIDEIIVPSIGTWNDLFDNITSNPDYEPKSSYNARNVYFFSDFMEEEDYFHDIPTYMHMLQHVYRTKNVMGSGLYIKSFHNTDLVLGVHNHYPFYCVETCKNMEINPEIAKLQHYRQDCVKEIKKCNDMKEERVLDTTVWRFKEELIKNVDVVIDTLKVE